MSDLLKQAIADAKAVRATALANAKAALEEAFAPKLQSMLSEKLRQEVQGMEEEEMPMAGETPAPAAEVPPPAPAEPEAQVPPTEPAAPMEEEEVAEDTNSYPGTKAGAGVPGYNLEEGEKASSDYTKTTKGHKTEDPGKNMVVDGDKLATHGSIPATKGTEKASDDYTKTTSGHKTEDPQGPDNAQVALEEGSIDEQSLEELLKELEQEVTEMGHQEAPAPALEGIPDPAAMDENLDEEVNLEELLKEEDPETNEGKDGMEEGKKKGKIPPQLAPYVKGKKDDDDGKKEKTDESVINENISLKKEVEEYRSAVEFLRDRINEVNLLNAKLLYANKLFKQANLTREQKIKVIESFDLTKSVREAKIVYATLAESFNFGAKKAVEPVKASTTVKTITEGLASKAVASTKPTKPAVIAEGADMANRFKKLAGIRK